MTSKNWNRVIFTSIALILLSYILYAVVFGIGTFADVLRGFEILHQRKQGADWNTLNYPDTRGAYSFFVAWWSPGQWGIPAFLIEIFGKHLQEIQLFLVVSCTLTGLYFYYKLFVKLKFSITISLASLLLIVTNQLFYWHYFMYYGGDLFVFAFLPIYILFLLKLSNSFSFKNLFLFVLLSFLGLFLKNTFVIFVIVGCVMLFFYKKLYSKINREKFIRLAIAALLILIPYFILYLSKGATPGTTIVEGTYKQIPNTIWGDLLYSWGSAIGILTRISPVTQKMIVFFENSGVFLLASQLILLIPSFFLFRFIFIKYRGGDSEKMYSIAFFFALPVLLVFNYLYLFNKAVSYDMRHFAPIAFLFAPALIEWIKSIKKWNKILFTAIICICLLDLGLFGFNAYQLHQKRAFYGELLLNKNETKILNFVNTWDKKHSNSLILSENYWLPLFAVKNNDKLSIRLKNKQWTVVSGMELDEAPVISVERLNLPQYDSILLLSNKKENYFINKTPHFSIRYSGVIENLNFYILVKK